MANEDKRIIELPASESILNDDWIAKDSASQDTTRLQLSFLKQLCGGNNFAGEWIAGHSYQFESYVTHEGKLYHNISGGNIQDSTWNASHWSEITVSGELIHLTSSIASWFRTSVSYKVGDIVIYNNRLYQCNTAHPAGAWNDSHFGSLSLNSVISGLKNRIYSDLAPTFVYTNSYNVGDYVTDGNYLYQCIVPHTGGWDSSHFRQVNVGDMLEEIVDNFASTFSPSISYSVGQFVVHNNTFYRCNTPHTGAWNWEHFSLTSVSDLVGRILFDIALPFSTTTNYAVGDYVTYNLNLYVCTTAHPAGTWNASHFTSVKVMDVIKEKVADVQIAGQTTVDEDKISDLTSLAIEGTASGEIASFSDGSNLPMRSFVCDIDAVQDLHGYDAPWVGGAGKNKLPYPYRESILTRNGVTFTVNDDGTVNVNGTATDLVIFTLVSTVITLQPSGNYILSGCPVGGAVNTYRLDTYWEGQGALFDTGSGVSISPNGSAITVRIVVFSGVTVNNLLFKPMIRLATETDPTFAPYSNICPISGHTGVNAWVRGKNQLPMTVDGIKAANTSGTWTGNAYTLNGITYTILTDNDGNVTGIKANGTASATNTIFDLNPAGSLTIPANTTFSLSGCPEGGGGSTYRLYPKGGASETYDNGSGKLITLNSAITNPFRINIYSGAQVDNIIFYPMIVYTNAIDMDFEPYNPNSQTIQVSWQTEAGEVFGGYVDLVSGELVVDRLYFEISNFDSWEYQGFNNFKALYTSLSALGYPPVKNTNDRKVISDKFKYMVSGAYQPFGVFSIYSNGIIYFWNNDDVYANKNEMIAAMNSIKPSVCYELATPITYQLTPTQIKSLLGNNNAWCDTGDVNVKFNKDATTVINSLIARIEALENA